jgi:hypothetical protein
VSVNALLIEPSGSTITAGGASSANALVKGRKTLKGDDTWCTTKKFWPLPEDTRMQFVNSELTTANHEMWTRAGMKFYDTSVGEVKQEVGQVFTSCPYFLAAKADGTEFISSVLTEQCQMPILTYEALYEPVLLVHMNYLMGTTNLGGVQEKALTGLCKHASAAYDAAGAVNKEFYLNMWPHFECWASAMQWQAGGEGDTWTDHLTSVATEFGILDDVPHSGSRCSNDPMAYIKGN